MLKQVRPAVCMIAAMTVLTGLVYPLTMTAVAHVVFPHQAAGSLIVRDGHVTGSELIGQNFITDKYFHGRPSTTSAPDPTDASKTVAAPYNAANSSGANAGPTSQALLDRIKTDIPALQQQNPGTLVPVDLVTTSASGLDPDITPAGATFQVPRVAQARGLTQEQLQTLVEQHTEGRLFGIFGEPRVNVLKLNMSLDAIEK